MNTLKYLLPIATIPLSATLVAQQAAKPNVIIILADDLGFADVGYHGRNSEIKTPNIDRLASQGAQFSNAYVTNAVSAPSRAGMLTGCYQQRFGFEDNPGPFRCAEGMYPGIPAEVKLIPEYLKSAGYATACIGKWHVGGEESDESFPTNRGFDEFFGFLGGASTYFHGKNEKELIYDNTKPAKMEAGYFTDIIGDKAIDFISRNKKSPFMLYLPFNAVHGPLQVPQELIDIYSDVKDPSRRKLCAMQHSMDQNIGRIMTFLGKVGLDKNTIVIFLSDNGGAPSNNHSYNTPFRGAKGTFFDGGIHTPFIVSWPNKIKAGINCDKLTSSLDIAPTICSAAGVALSKPMDGVDLMPYISGSKLASPHETLYWKMNSKWAVRDMEWKALFNPDEGDMLFNLAKDPSETTNLIAANPAKFKELKAKLDAWYSTCTPAKWGWQPQVGEYIQHTEESFENICKFKFAPIGHTRTYVTTNPNKGGINTSDNVLCVEYGEEAPPYAGGRANIGRFIKKFRYAHVKVLKETAGVVKIKITGDKDDACEVASTTPYVKVGEWQDMVFDVDYYKAVNNMFIMPDYNKNHVPCAYIDDIIYSDNPNPRK